MLGAVKYGFSNIANFSGRDARQTFWYYVLFVYILNVVITMIVSVPMSISMMTGTIRAAARNPDNEVVVRAATIGAVNDIASTLMWASVLAGVLMLVLLAASFVRRLHDSGLSGYWALIPGALHVAALAMMPGNVRRMTESLANIGGDPFAGVKALQMQAGVASVVGWLPIIIVVLLGIRKSTPGPNRFGEASVSF